MFFKAIAPLKTKWPLLPAAAALALCIGAFNASFNNNCFTTPQASAEMIAEVLDLTDDNGSLILHGDYEDGVLMIILLNE